MSGTTLNDIRLKIRRITGRPSTAQITDAQIDDYINTFYIYDFPEHLRLESLRSTFQFTTSANQATYDFPIEYFLTTMPPAFIAGYSAFVTQSRKEFYQAIPRLNFKETVAVGAGAGPYAFTLTNTPIIQGYKQNPPGAYSDSTTTIDVPARELNWMVLISGPSNGPALGVVPSVSLIDDGQGNLFDPADTSTKVAIRRGTINYLTGAVSITAFKSAIAAGGTITAQYVPYVASRPISILFYQDQFTLWPVPDQAYNVSIEAYKYPTALLDIPGNQPSPQLKEWWQCLAYGAADKIFTDNADFENAQKFRGLLEEQLKLIQRRSIVQQTSERTATIYTNTDNSYSAQFNNNFYGY